MCLHPIEQMQSAPSETVPSADNIDTLAAPLGAVILSAAKKLVPSNAEGSLPIRQQ